MTDTEHRDRGSISPPHDERRRPARLRLGLNLLWLVPGEVGGSEDYALSLLQALAPRQDLELVAFCQPALPAVRPDLTETARLVVSPGGESRRVVRLVWESTWLPRQVRRRGVDVVHHLGGTVPLVAATPSVLTLHDLQPLTHPERFSPAKRTWLRATLPSSARRAGAVLTLTPHVRERVLRHLPVPPERVHVTPPGPLWPATTTDATSPEAVRDHYGLAGPLLLYPAISYPHKNHEVLVRALPRLLPAHPDVTLVLTGRPGPTDDRLDALAEELGVGHAVRRLGRVPQGDLYGLYDAAAALVFPSVHEGFGLPLLEAMTRGRPILAADASAIPDVVSDAGALLPPHDPGAWAEALAALLSDPARAAALATAAERGAARYSWERIVPEMVALYRAVARLGA